MHQETGETFQTLADQAKVEDAALRGDGRQPERVEHLAPHCEGSPHYQVTQI